MALLADELGSRPRQEVGLEAGAVVVQVVSTQAHRGGGGYITASSPFGGPPLLSIDHIAE